MIECEKAVSSDIPAIAELYQSAFPDALLAVFGKSRLPSAVVTDLLGALYRHDPSGFIVARDGGRLAGFIIVSSNRQRLAKGLLREGTLTTLVLRWIMGRYPGLGLRFVPRLAVLAWNYWKAEKNPAADRPAMAQVLSIVVAPEMQRRGIGQRLTELALAALRQARVTLVRLEVDAAKEAPIRLYQKMGFKEIARLPTPRGLALVMTCRLSF